MSSNVYNDHAVILSRNDACDKHTAFGYPVVPDEPIRNAISFFSSIHSGL